MFERLLDVSTVLESTAGTAAEMTDALCQLGDGSMGDGIAKVFGSGLEVGFTVGNLRGLLKGAATTVAVVGGTALVVGGGIYIAKKLKNRKAKKLAAQLDAEVMPEAL